MDTVDAADYLRLATPAEPRVAPDGERVAFVRETPRPPDDGEGGDDNSDGEGGTDGDADGSDTEDRTARQGCEFPGYEEMAATIYVASLGGEAPRRFTAEAGVDGCPRWSPSGDRLAFTSDRGDAPGAQLWVLPTDGGEARRVTCVPGGVSALAWGPDGDRIAFCQPVTAADRESGRDRGVPESYEPEAPDPRVIDRTVYRSAQEYTDGERVHVYVADLTADADRDGTSAGGATDAEESDEATEDAVVTRVTDGDVDHTAPAWGDDGALYTAAREPSDPDADPDDAVEFAIKRYDADDETGRLGVDADGAVEAETLVHDTGWEPMLSVASDGRVAYASTPNVRGTLEQTDVHVYDPETDAVRVPTAGLDRTFAHEPTLQFGPSDESVYVTTPETGSVVVRRVPVAPAGAEPLDGEEGADSAEPADGEDGKRVDGDDDGAQVGGDDEIAVVAGEGMHCSDFHVAGGLLAFAASEWDHPGDVFAATPRGAETTRLSTLNRGYLADRAIVQPEEVRFAPGDATAVGAEADALEAMDSTGVDSPGVESPGEDSSADDAPGVDGEIQGWLFTPPERGPEAAAPLVVSVHGGPHISWTPAGTMWLEFQALAAAGFAVFACNPRGSTGYGNAFQAAIEGDWGAQTAADVLAGVDAVRERDAVDDSETFVAGGSFGGYLTAWLLAHTDEFDAGVPQRGVYDLVSFYGSTDAAYKLIEWDWGTTPWDDPDRLAEHSPALAADEITAPTLLLHADDDYRVPVAGAELLYRGLRKHGTPTRFVRYPREGHELSRAGEPRHVVDRLQRIRDWFEGYSTHHDTPEPL